MTAGDNRNHFVLIPGAWHGGWVWRHITDGLRRCGHTVSALTLTGLGERCHLATDNIGLTTHVRDVVQHLEMEDLCGATLVGWSYGGLVAAGVAAQAAHRIRRIIYLDAFVPEDGRAAIDYFPPAARSALDVYRQRERGIPPYSPDELGITDSELANYVQPRLRTQPWRTFYEPVRLQSAGRIS